MPGARGGRGVLVAAPTGAGKTVVGEFAVHLALAGGKKAFYTTPIKALSNQKYGDLVRRYGPDQVGLLTGDTSVNGDAPVVVMTTEVLRNMLYAGSDALHGLGYVVMDEVHYLADRFRGPVWEEVIIHLPPEVQLVSLSATVSNAEEFGDWLEMVRGDTAVVVSEHRPVPLGQHVLTRGALLDLYAGHVDPTAPGPNPPINPDLMIAMRRRDREGGGNGGGGPNRGGPGHRGRGDRGYRGGGEADREAPPAVGAPASGPPPVRRRRRPRRGRAPARHLLHLLPRRLPGRRLAVPVRRGAPDHPAAGGGDPPDRRGALREHPAGGPAGPGVLGVERGAGPGVAAHHAGMLPLFKETVEDLFSRGLVKVVFATETLALGINMPARSVVLEKLVKWDGSNHVDVTPGEYTQLTGRAGRRGIDTEGHAVVVDHPGLDPVALAGLASKRLYPLRSSFRPTYNMAVNLVAQVGRERAREVLETSFAQFQADRGVVGLARQAQAHTEALAGYAEAMRCHLGDFGEYAAIRRSISDREQHLTREATRERRADAMRSLEGVRVGDVVEIGAGRRAGYAVVLEPATHSGFDGPQPLVLTTDRQVRRLSVADSPGGVRTVTRIKVPKGFNGRNAPRAATSPRRCASPCPTTS
ncbi:DEAD/DEAH box helicase [Cellulomonas sp. ATA003]|uniref:DEAD/DEAH box helicase n=1 Tax=Cellulomonas sp. ATA003 TaxID=3073064 RepID=UPI00287397A6|nr:DEAD/DEAH box helicase [Cellulomonas sp. ATA003]WNB87497.1 DEAD/DEAH box helicase [Cellulomonas sp. ATA003]